ncbi:hypothetical protein VA249_36270 [Vibrio alfacsensis]|nr:hypothetical protein VA249_36270 [Vibrio alfacsensis]
MGTRSTFDQVEIGHLSNLSLFLREYFDLQDAPRFEVLAILSQIIGNNACEERLLALWELSIFLKPKLNYSFLIVLIHIYDVTC